MPMTPEPLLEPPALNAFLDRAFPESAPEERGRVERVAPGEAWVALEPTLRHLRPGGIVSGPTLMGLADVAAYAVILAHIGEVAMAVTSALNYQFLRPCPHEIVRAHASFVKLGKRQAVVDVRLYADSVDGPVGQAIVTYAIPSAQA